MNVERWCRRGPSTIALLATPAGALGQALQGSVSLETFWFDQSSTSPAQRRVQAALVLQPEWQAAWGPAQALALRLHPYLRWDADDPASRYLDLREAVLEHSTPQARWRVGFDMLSWVAVESHRLVDIVNQLDPRADPDLEAKLGQPLVSYTRFLDDWGRVDALWMPWFRPRPAAGPRNRLAGPLPVDRASPQGLGPLQRHNDWALRWSGTVQGADLGLYHFRGLSREPDVAADGSTGYRSIQQTGLDLQWPQGSMLWKLEALHRSGQGRDFGAWVAGGEYTFSQPRFDLGLLFETLGDRRDDSAPPTRFAKAWFAGARLTPADAGGSELLLGALRDRQHRAWAYKLEFSRRLSEHWRAGLVGRKVVADDDAPPNPSTALERESHLQLTLTHSF
jgi:hypothetical protein